MFEYLEQLLRLKPLAVCLLPALNDAMFCFCFLQDTASLGSQKGGISKHGWLYKGNMNSAISVTMRVSGDNIYFITFATT